MSSMRRSAYGQQVPSISLDGPHTTKPGTARVFRGSKKRVRRIRMRDYMSLAMWCYIVLMAALLFIGLPWMAKHPVEFHRPSPTATRSGEAARDSTHAP
ncbi:MAG TPA: hypothetical protein VLV86_22475 [Vicinamibacterales bacterium]|nr:hypothetical protein [Vicinamibacterales bacterium]